MPLIWRLDTCECVIAQEYLAGILQSEVFVQQCLHHATPNDARVENQLRMAAYSTLLEDDEVAFTVPDIVAELDAMQNTPGVVGQLLSVVQTLVALSAIPEPGARALRPGRRIDAKFVGTGAGRSLTVAVDGVSQAGKARLHAAAQARHGSKVTVL